LQSAWAIARDRGRSYVEALARYQLSRISDIAVDSSGGEMRRQVVDVLANTYTRREPLLETFIVGPTDG